MGRPSKYSPEFRDDAVKLVLDSTSRRQVANVARELGLVPETLRNWVVAAEKRRASAAAGGQVDADDQASNISQENTWTRILCSSRAATTTDPML